MSDNLSYVKSKPDQNSSINDTTKSLKKEPLSTEEISNLQEEVDASLNSDLDLHLLSMLKSSYESCCLLLKNKYGEIEGSFFVDSNSYRRNVKIVKEEQGLFIHHIDEDKIHMLSNPEIARKNLWLHQLGDKLVYCNLLEHLILHMKIIENKVETNKAKRVIYSAISENIIPELNDIYSGVDYTNSWRSKVAENIWEFKKEYLYCIYYLLQLGYKEPIYTTHIRNKRIWKIEYNDNLFVQFDKILSRDDIDDDVKKAHADEESAQLERDIDSMVKISKKLYGVARSLDLSLDGEEPKFDQFQEWAIQLGVDAGVDVRIYANPKYSGNQMNVILDGIFKDIDVEQYLDVEMSADDMWRINIKLSIEKGYSGDEIIAGPDYWFDRYQDEYE